MGERTEKQEPISEDEKWADFSEWCSNKFIDSEMTIEEAYNAVKIGIATIRAMRDV